MSTWMVVLGLAVALAGSVCAETYREDVEMDIGSMVPKANLTAGWSVSEMRDGIQYRWIKRVEADFRVTIDEPGDATLTLRARPQYLPYTRQVVAVYVNGRFVDETVCSDRAEFETYRFEIPKERLKAGENRFTLRMAYCKQVGPDRRELALCVDTIRVQVR